jgi:hypothetical protein
MPDEACQRGDNSGTANQSVQFTSLVSEVHNRLLYLAGTRFVSFRIRKFLSSAHVIGLAPDQGRRAY